MRRSMARFSGREEKSEINLTPMLDVVFIMLIFFIVTATFIKEPGTDILRPEALTAEVKPTVSVLVGINAANEIWIDK
ncbi:MAG: biopolymer transporter ExbD, partial [Gammaproteobacteria bacterium]|nr:biopolymer transporter ExbD [Gammaproteobacteria bacterium]